MKKILFVLFVVLFALSACSLPGMKSEPVAPTPAPALAQADARATDAESKLAEANIRAESAEAKVKELTDNPIVTTKVVTEEVRIEVPVEKIVEVTKVITVEVSTLAAPMQLVTDANKIPGATVAMATMKEPATWVADNGQACLWDVPGGTRPEARTDQYVFTNCMTINLASKAEFDFDWQYGNWDYWNGTHAMTVTHSVRDFLLWNWASPDGEPKYAGIAWWGPQTGSLATVRYNDGQPCTGRSFEVPADSSMHIVGVITNTSERTAAVWSQGPWVLKENVKYGGGGIYEPECRPGIYGNQIPAAPVASAKDATQAVSPQTAPKVPDKDTEVKTVVDNATYDPIVFTAKGESFKVQHLGDWSFHLAGWDIDTKADNFVCTWYDWTTKQVITKDWTGDYRLECKWSPPTK